MWCQFLLFIFAGCYDFCRRVQFLSAGGFEMSKLLLPLMRINLLFYPQKHMKTGYLLIRKCSKECISADLTRLANELGVCRDTLANRMPYWEDADYIVCRFVSIKSNRGRKSSGNVDNLKKYDSL